MRGGRQKLLAAIEQESANEAAALLRGECCEKCKAYTCDDYGNGYCGARKFPDEGADGWCELFTAQVIHIGRRST
jgi:hypothetical protein